MVALLSNEFPSKFRGKAFLKWTRVDLFSKLSVTYGGNVNYYKSVHHLIPTLPVGTGNRTLKIRKRAPTVHLRHQLRTRKNVHVK